MTGTDARERAADFVRAHGGELERARAEALLGRADAARVASLLGEPDAADALALCRVLSICQEARLLHSPLAQRTCAAAAELQQPDGGFGADASLEERLRRTGGLGGALARTPYARPETLDAAGGFLASHFSPDLLQGFQWGNVAAYAQFFANALHDASDEILQWCGRELERGFRARRFDALHTLRVFVECEAHALPGARLDPEELLLSLLSEQALDGSFGDAPGAGQRVEPTLVGLRALGFAGRASSRHRPGALSC